VQLRLRKRSVYRDIAALVDEGAIAMDDLDDFSDDLKDAIKLILRVLHNPEILFLDEPTTGLDPNYRNILWDQMLKMNQEGTTIFLTTHYMEEVENFCRHVVIMKKGEMLAYGTVKELGEKTGTDSLNDVFLVLTGFMLPAVGILPESFPTHMFCGMIGMSMLITGIHGTAVPVSMDFHNLREIEDRLLAPVSTRTVAYAKMFVGIPLLILVLILTAMASAALGLLVGTVVKPNQIAAMFPGFLMPVVFLGSIFYTWNQLSPLPVMQIITLIDPLTWINEAIRAVMTPQIESLPLALTIAGILAWIVGMGILAMKRFDRMVYNH
jgi:ABC-2 type transport system permease protein